jgi:antitoxin component YwqK of YwqJK toxin-antitoxin module
MSSFMPLCAQIEIPKDSSFFTVITCHSKYAQYNKDYCQVNRWKKDNHKYDFLYTKAKNGDNFYEINLFRNHLSESVINFYPGTYKIMNIMQISDTAMDGKIITFNKRGKVELIADYKNGKLLDVIYYRKEKYLRQYLEDYKERPPMVFEK